MSLYGDCNIKLESLKKWARELDEDAVMDKVSHSGNYGNFSIEALCRGLFKAFKEAIGDLKEGDDWRSTQQVLNMALMPAVFMVSDNAIRVGDYYECLVTYADVATKKKLIKGFQYKEIGEINIYGKDGSPIGQIGMKSDLIWSCMYDSFIHNDQSSVEHTLPDHEEILSIQLGNTFGKTEKKIRKIIDEIIFKCSIEYNLNFVICHLDPLIKELGELGHYDLNTTLGEYDDVPMMYFNNALGANDVRIKYLSYYQVLEYFFNRAQNFKLLADIKSGGYITDSSIDHTRLKSILKDYVSTIKESESLKLVLSKAIDVTGFKTWINSDPDKITNYINTGDSNRDINLSKNDEKIISKLASRIYSYRCSIAHAKGDIEEFVALPEISNGEIEKELPLIRYVAIATITKCSNWTL